MDSLLEKYVAVFWEQHDSGAHLFYAGQVKKVTKTHIHVAMNFGQLEKVPVADTNSLLVFKEPYLEKELCFFAKIKPLVTKFKLVEKPIEVKPVAVPREKKGKVKSAVKPVETGKEKSANAKIVKCKQETKVKPSVVKSDVIKVDSVEQAKPVEQVTVSTDSQPKTVVKEPEVIQDQKPKVFTPPYLTIGEHTIKFVPTTQQKVSVETNGNCFYLLNSDGSQVEDDIGLPIYLESAGTAGSVARLLMKHAAKAIKS